MKKISLFAILLAAAAMTACTDYKAEITEAHDSRLSACGDIWCALKNEQIDVPGGGEWFSFSDQTEGEGGTSYFLWSYGGNATVGEDVPFGLVIREWGGVSGSFALGERYDTDEGLKYPFADLAIRFFNVINAASWGGICVQYKSTSDLKLMLSFEGEELYAYDKPMVILYGDHSEDLMTSSRSEVRALRWEDFSPEGWSSNCCVSTTDAVARLKGINFQFAENVSDKSGQFKIISIGSYDSCYGI